MGPSAFPACAGGWAAWPAPSLSHLCSLGQAVESVQAEDESAQLCKRRIEHLKEHSSDQPAAAGLWKRKRMDRMMAEHLLRCGYYNTAVKLARQSGIEVGDGGGASWAGLRGMGAGQVGGAPWMGRARRAGLRGMGARASWAGLHRCPGIWAQRGSGRACGGASSPVAQLGTGGVLSPAGAGVGAAMPAPWVHREAGRSAGGLLRAARAPGPAGWGSLTRSPLQTVCAFLLPLACLAGGCQLCCGAVVPLVPLACVHYGTPTAFRAAWTTVSALVPCSVLVQI